MRLLALLLLAATGCGHPLRAERLLDGADLGGATLTGVDLDPDGTPVVGLADDLYDTGRGERLIAQRGGGIVAFAAAGPTPVFLRNGRLQTLEADGPRALVEVPLFEPSLADDGERIWVAGHWAFRDASSLYVALRDGRWQRLLELPERVDALTVAGGRVYFTMGSVVFGFRLGEAVVAEAALPGIEPITGLAVDPERNVLFVSDGKATWALLPAQGRVVLLFTDAGGPLAWRDDALYLLDRTRNALFRLDDVSAILTRSDAPLVELR